jgi:tetratricopeptide (TPR) repeat protein
MKFGMLRSGFYGFARPLALVATLLASSPAIAEQADAWDRARQPDLEKRRETIDAAEQMLTAARVVRRGSASPAAKQRIVQNQANVARSLLTELEPTDCQSADVCFLLMTAAELLDDDAATIRLGERVEALFPDDRRVHGALFQVAVSHARLGERDKELAAYSRYLVLVEDPDERYTPLANRAESRFAMGDADAALADYREAITLRPGRDGVLARLGLAFSLDRLGDFSGALREAKEAALVDGSRSELEGTGVFFVPPYEIEWYRALVEAGRAEIASKPEDKALMWELSGRFYELFARRADAKDKAVPLAKARAKLAAKLAAKWKGQAKKNPSPRSREDDLPLPGSFGIP